jgi:hypothetical protein
VRGLHSLAPRLPLSQRANASGEVSVEHHCAEPVVRRTAQVDRNVLHDVEQQ